MGYGARVRRVPALGGANLSDVDVMKVGLIGKTERGFKNIVQKEIYSMNDFYFKCGGFNRGYYAAYVAQNFFDELSRDFSCEMKVLSFTPNDAAQASAVIVDGLGASIFTISAGRLGVQDFSAFGNKIAYQIEQKENLTMKLTSPITDGDVTCVLNDVSNLRVGYYIKFVEGANEEVRVITSIDVATKTVGFAAISESTGFSVNSTTVYRVDWNLKIAVKDSLGNYQKKEEWEGPMAKSDSIGVSYDVNNPESGSNFVLLDVTTANASPPESQCPADVTTWTALTAGSDGTGAVDADWKTLAETHFGSEVFTILLAPESSSITHNQNMVTFATNNYKGLYYVQGANDAEELALQNLGASLRGSIVFGMIPSDKWISVSDPTVLGGYMDIPKVGMDAAHWFNTLYKFGESKVAAGNKPEMVLRSNVKLRDGNGLVHDDMGGVGGRLIRNYSVNICKYTRGVGITNNSARTLSTDDGYKYQNQILQWILYARSIVAYLKLIEQDRSGRVAQETHRNTVWAYMKKKFDAGHLYQGQKEDGSLTEFKDVCIIVNDFTINTLVNINNGIEEIFLQFVAPPPIEEPILSLASAGVTTVRA